MREIIIQKINELTELCAMADERNAQIVLTTLSGSMHGMQDDLLAGKVQEFTKDVLIPNLEAAKRAQNAAKN